MPKDFLDLDATPERLRALASAGVLPPAALERALHLAVASPPKPEWRRFLSISLMGLGSLLVLSGVIYFFAYNWADLHRFAKLGLLMAAIAATAVGAWRLGEGLPGQFSLMASAVLVGPLLAVYGQVYQTGADAYGLFLGWAVLILPWVALARFAPLWLLLLVVLNTGISLFWTQVLDDNQDLGSWLMVVLGLLNGFAWATHEHFANRGVSWLQGRWMPRVLALMTASPLSFLAAAFIVDSRDVGTAAGVVALLLVAASLAAEYALHRHLHGELFLLTVGAVSVMTLLTTAVGRFLVEDLELKDSALFVLAVVVLGQVGLAVWWLRNEARITGATEES